MAPSLSWKCYLKLSLVSCAVAMVPAKSGNEKIRFNNLNRETGNRLKQQYLDSETGDVVERDDITRGYQYEKGKYIRVEEEDLDAVAIESKRTIDIDFSSTRTHSTRSISTICTTSSRTTMLPWKPTASSATPWIRRSGRHRAGDHERPRALDRRTAARDGLPAHATQIPL